MHRIRRSHNIGPSAMAAHAGIDADTPVPCAWSPGTEEQKTFPNVEMRGISPVDPSPEVQTLARKLSARQVQMIAIGGLPWTVMHKIYKLTFM